MELNYSLRSHIFSPVKRKIVTDAFDDSVEIRTLEPMEIFAAKANALMSRAAARDLYDFNNMLFMVCLIKVNMNFLESALFFMHLFLKRSLVLSSVNFKRECEGEELCCQIQQLPFIMVKVRKTKEKVGKTGGNQKKQLSFQ